MGTVIIDCLVIAYMIAYCTDMFVILVTEDLLVIKHYPGKHSYTPSSTEHVT